MRFTPAQVGRGLPQLDARDPAVVRQPPALVGPPDPGLVPRRRGLRRPDRAAEGEGWERDEDVLDTWFSSALWPFATLGWPERTPELEKFYPTNVLSTARDIIFLWVARMVMMGDEFLGEEPFTEVYIHSVIQAPDGRRMSKSLGTGIDPLEVIDAARRRRPAVRPADDVEHPGRALLAPTASTRAASSSPSSGTPRGWSSTAAAAPASPRPAGRTLADRWIASRVAARRRARRADLTARFELSQLAEARLRAGLRRLLRLVPGAAEGGRGDPRGRRLRARADPGARPPAHAVRDGGVLVARCRAPRASWPSTRRRVAPGQADPAAEAEMAAVQEVVTALRAYRSTPQPAAPDPPGDGPGPRRRRSPPSTRSRQADEAARPTLVATLLPGGRSISVGPLAEAVDPEVERTRLRGRAREGRERARPRAAQAGRRALRGARPRAPGRGRAREGGPLRRRARGPGRPHRRAGVTPAGRPAPGSRGWRSSACASAWSASGRCSPPSATRSDAAPALHVVGTNGKSSTTRLAAAALAGTGRRVGTYLSPHIVDWTERVQLDGAPVGRGRLRRGGDRRARRRRGAAAGGGGHRHPVRGAHRDRVPGVRGGRAWTRWRSRRGSAGAGTRPTCCRTTPPWSSPT